MPNLRKRKQHQKVWPPRVLDFDGLDFGLWYGFPRCCIDAFLKEHTLLDENHPMWGTGFLPCSACTEEARDVKTFVANKITPNRYCPFPFPRGSISKKELEMVPFAKRKPYPPSYYYYDDDES